LGKKVVHTLTSRGCPYNCNFCAATEIFKQRIRYRNVDLVIKELKKYVELGYDSVIFYDDIFTCHKKRVLDLCEKMISDKLNLKWMCFTRTNTVNGELLTKMKDAGCYLITFGCESGNQKTLDLLNKKLTIEQNRQGIKLTHQAGILAASSFMIGLPQEDRLDIEQTLDFARASELTYAYFPIFEPYKGTPIFEISKQEGYWKEDSRFKNSLLGYQEEIWVPKGVTREEIEKLAKKAFKIFYLRPKIIFRILKHLISKLSFSRKVKFLFFVLDYFILKNFRFLRKRRFGAKY
ncbi:MAG: radical SAM protein, partial [Candidatus Omnitrophota bacterium]